MNKNSLSTALHWRILIGKTVKHTRESSPGSDCGSRKEASQKIAIELTCGRNQWLVLPELRSATSFSE